MILGFDTFLISEMEELKRRSEERRRGGQVDDCDGEDDEDHNHDCDGGDGEDNMIMDMMEKFTRIMIMIVLKIITIIIPPPSQENGQGREIGDRSEAAQNKIRDLRKQARW